MATTGERKPKSGGRAPAPIVQLIAPFIVFDIQAVKHEELARPNAKTGLYEVTLKGVLSSDDVSTVLQSTRDHILRVQLGVNEPNDEVSE